MTIYYKVIPWSDEATGVNEVDTAASDYGYATIGETARHIRDAADYIIAVGGWTSATVDKGGRTRLYERPPLSMGDMAILR